MTPNKVKQRNTYIELLRIILMQFILWLHIWGHGTSNLSIFLIGSPHMAPFIVMLKLGVTGFIFITAWGGGNFYIKKVIHLLVISLFYSTSIYIIFWQHTDIYSIIKSFFPLNNQGWWYIQCYLFLLMLLPFINYGWNKISESIKFFLFILTFFYCYIDGFISASNSIDLKYFICVYIISRYILQDKIQNFFRQKSEVYAIVSLLSLLLLAYIICKFFPNQYLIKMIISNNNVLLLALIYFITISISKHFLNSPFINKLASGTLAAYLITEHNLIRTPLNAYLFNLSLYSITLALLISSTILISCILIEITRTLLCKGIDIKITNQIEKLTNKIVNT